MKRLLNRIHHARAGGVVIEWLFCLPIFCVLFFLILQMALLASAGLVVRYATFAAARAAAVGLPDHLKANTETTAAIILACISPRRRGDHQEARVFGETLRRQGAPWSFRGVADRAAFAQIATDIRISPDEILGGPEDLSVQIKFPFRLNMPFAATVLAPRARTIAGVRGHYIDISARVDLRSHGSRVAASRFSLGRLTP